MVYEFYTLDGYVEEVKGDLINALLKTLVNKYSKQLSKNHHVKSKDKNMPYAKVGLDKRAFFSELALYIQNFRLGDSFKVEESAYYNIADLADSLVFMYQNLSDIEDLGPDFFSEECYGFIRGENSKHEFQEDVNQILERNGLNFHLNKEGKFVRNITEDFHDLLNVEAPSINSNLEKLLADSKDEIVSHQKSVRENGLEKIIDAFQHVKSLYAGEQDEIRGLVKKLIDNVSIDHEEFSEFLNEIMSQITNLSNSASIRHKEKYQNPLVTDIQVDYLYQITLSTINILLVGYSEEASQ